MKKDYVIQCDGFLKHNGMEHGCSVGLLINDKVKFTRTFLYKGSNFAKIKVEKETSNVMEYYAMYKALKLAAKIRKKYPSGCNVIIYSDSQLIVNQVNGSFVTANKDLAKLRDRCREVRPWDIKVLWISRTANVKVLGH